MFDYNFSTIESILLLLVASIAFFLIGKYFAQRQMSGLQNRLVTANAELTTMEKQVRANDKIVQNVTNEKERFSKENVNLNERLTMLSKDNENLRKQLEPMQSGLAKESKQVEVLNRQIEDLKAKLSKANEKNRLQHKTDADWKAEIEQAKREVKKYQSDITSVKSNNAKLQQKLKQVGIDAEELEKLRSEAKGNAKEIKRLTKDCKYWEKQHYDTHHKLAAQLETEESLKQIIENSKLEKQRLEIKEENMKKTLADYKQQLIYANERYHKMQGA